MVIYPYMNLQNLLNCWCSRFRADLEKLFVHISRGAPFGVHDEPRISVILDGLERIWLIVGYWCTDDGWICSRILVRIVERKVLPVIATICTNCDHRVVLTKGTETPERCRNMKLEGFRRSRSPCSPRHLHPGEAPLGWEVFGKKGCRSQGGLELAVPEKGSWHHDNHGV